jgi:hypothetical protein
MANIKTAFVTDQQRSRKIRCLPPAVDDPAKSRASGRRKHMSPIVMMVAAAMTHSIDINHRGSPVQVTYSAHPEIDMKTIGAATPNRMEGRRCLWTAMIKVDRQLSGSQATTRTVSFDRTLSGSRHGPCGKNSRAMIEKELAARESVIKAHLLEVAQQDQAPLRVELDTIGNLASN